MLELRKNVYNGEMSEASKRMTDLTTMKIS